MHFDQFIEILCQNVPTVAHSRSSFSKDVTKSICVAVGDGFPRNSGIQGINLIKNPGSRSLAECLLRGDCLHGDELFQEAKHLPQDVALEKLVFFVKDASPDSLLAVVVLLAILLDVAGNSCFERWLEAITSWEEGVMPADPYQSWPALASALSHSRFPAGQNEVQKNQEYFQRAWECSFRFLAESMGKGRDPVAMKPETSGLHQQASIALRRLEQIYLDILAHAQILHLSVPLHDAPGKRVMVDTLCYIEDEESDAVKLFGRVDKMRSAGGHGFALGVSYRPKSDPWNRFTIHADPGAGLDLTDLWQMLEWKETDQWRDENSMILRPADATTLSADTWNSVLPRSIKEPDDLDKLMIRNGTARPLAGLNNIWVDPWFLKENMTLIGSPGKAIEGQTPCPSRLAWSDVINTVWEAYNPLSSIRVNAQLRDDGDAFQEIDLIAVPPLQLNGPSPHGPFFRFVHWIKAKQHSVHNRALVLNDTSVSIFAALAGRGTESGPIRLEDLPPAAACKCIELSGGFAVITHKGCIVVDDWHDQSLNRDVIVEALGKVVEGMSCCQKHLKNLTSLNDRLLEWGKKSRKETEIFRIIGDAVQYRSTFLAEQNSYASSHISDSNARIIYDSLFAFWGISLRSSHIEEGYAQFEQSAKSLQDVRSARFLRVISIVGLPAAIATTICKPVAVFINSAFLSSGYPITRILKYFGISATFSNEVVDVLLSFGEIIAWIVCTLILYLAVTNIMKIWDPTKQAKAPSRESSG